MSQQLQIPAEPITASDYKSRFYVMFLLMKDVGETLTIHCEPGKGANFVQAVRQSMSRGRNIARRKKGVDGIKQFTLHAKVEQTESHDVVTLSREQAMTHQISELLTKIESGK